MEFIIPTPEKPLHPHIAGKLIYEIPIGTGSGDQGRFNEWSYDVTLVHDRFRTLFALRAVVSEGTEDELPPEDHAPFHMLVMVDPLVDDNDWIAWRLLQEYGKLERPSIHFWAGTGDLDIWRGEQLNWELGIDQ